MVEFTSEPLWFWLFLVLKVGNYLFNFFNRSGCTYLIDIQTACFFCEVGAGLLRTDTFVEYALTYFKMVTFPLLLLEAQEDFSVILTENLLSVPGSEAHKCGCVPFRLGSPEFTSLSPIHTEPLATCQLQFRFSYSSTTLAVVL